nr:hypothetical protein [uncultured Dethiosulfovibrio sp.]
MAVKGTDFLTLADLQKRLDPSNKIANVIEMLNDTNEILADVPWVECNDGTGHITTIRVGLPEPTWRRLNSGVSPQKSETMQVRDTTGMLEAYGECDAKLSKLAGDEKAFRLSEDVAQVEGMNQEFVRTLIYGDTRTTPEKFFGLAPRFNTPTSNDTKSGYNILNAGGTGDDNTSIWVVGWGPRSIHGIFPKGTNAGLKMQNLGEQTKTLADGSMLQVLRSHYEWDCGLSVRDWRYIVRIANVDVSDLGSASAANLVNLLIEASERIPDGQSGVRPVIYCNKTVRTALRLQILAKNNVNLTWDTVAGKKVLAFDGMPVKRCDALLNTESAVSFS